LIVRGRSTFAATVAARKEFVQRNPAATKRAVRAILKAT